VEAGSGATSLKEAVIRDLEFLRVSLGGSCPKSPGLQGGGGKKKAVNGKEKKRADARKKTPAGEREQGTVRPENHN